MLDIQKYRYCLLAGCFAAGGSFFGKMPTFLVEHKLVAGGLQSLPEDIQYYAEFLVIKCIPISVMILCNILNWRYFLKALQLTEQTLTATVLTSASNYIVSFIFAALIYQEPITVLSTLGTTFIVMGLWFLCDDSTKNLKKKDS